MESVQCHLSCRLTNRLSSQRSDHFSRLCLSQMESAFNFSHNPFKCISIKFVFFQYSLGCKSRSHQRTNQDGCVALSFLAQWIFSLDNDEFINCLTNRFDN